MTHLLNDIFGAARHGLRVSASYVIDMADSLTKAVELREAAECDTHLSTSIDKIASALRKALEAHEESRKCEAFGADFDGSFPLSYLDGGFAIEAILQYASNDKPDAVEKFSLDAFNGIFTVIYGLERDGVFVVLRLNDGSIGVAAGRHVPSSTDVSRLTALARIIAGKVVIISDEEDINDLLPDSLYTALGAHRAVQRVINLADRPLIQRPVDIPTVHYLNLLTIGVGKDQSLFKEALLVTVEMGSTVSPALFIEPVKKDADGNPTVLAVFSEVFPYYIGNVVVGDECAYSLLAGEVLQRKRYDSLYKKIIDDIIKRGGLRNLVIRELGAAAVAPKAPDESGASEATTQGDEDANLFCNTEPCHVSYQKDDSPKGCCGGGCQSQAPCLSQEPEEAKKKTKQELLACRVSGAFDANTGSDAYALAKAITNVLLVDDLVPLTADCAHFFSLQGVSLLLSPRIEGGETPALLVARERLSDTVARALGNAGFLVDSPVPRSDLPNIFHEAFEFTNLPS